MAGEAGQDVGAAEPVSPSGNRPRAAHSLIAGLVVLVGLTGWLGWRDLHLRRDETVRAQMVNAAREGLLALTTIDHQQVDAGVQRILEASTGSFRDEFDQRADGFKEAARKAQSESVGTVTEAAAESVDGDRGEVLVAMTVMTSNRGVPEQQPKAWRTRVTVTKDGGEFKVAAVEFVP